MKNDFLLLFSTWNKRVSTRLYRVGRALPGLIKNARLLLNILVLRCSFYEFITRLKLYKRIYKNLYNVIYGRRANYRKVKRHGSSFGFDSHSRLFSMNRIGSFYRVARWKNYFKTFDSNIGISSMFDEKGFRDY